jgi:colanic acid/amylovoran biosynthesis protein
MPLLSHQPPYILMINLHSSCNAGDAALTLAAIHQLKENFPGCTLTLAINDPGSYRGSEKVVGSFFTWIKPLSSAGHSTWNLSALAGLVLGSLATGIVYRISGKEFFFLVSEDQKALLRAYLRADLVVSKPGNILYSSGKLGLVFLLTVYLMSLAVLLKKNVYLFPESIGPIKHSWEKRLAGWLLKRMRIIMLREEISLQEIRSAGVLNHPRCHLLPDTVFSFIGAPQAQGEAWLAEAGVDTIRDHPLLGITAINWGAQNHPFSRQAAYENALVEAIRAFLARHGGRAIFLPQVTGPTPAEDDRIAARRIIARLGGLPVSSIEQTPDPGTLKAAIGQVDLLIGTRMHSHIFALTEGVPVLAIGYLHKPRGILRRVGMEDRMLDIEQVTGENLSQMLEWIWSERMILRKQILAQLPALTSQARQAGSLIAADYNALLKEGG